MSLIRKVFWPAVALAGFAVVLAGMNVSPSARVQAVGNEGDKGDLCAIEGPQVIAVGQTALYVFRVQDMGSDLPTDLAVFIDNVSGDSEITSVVESRFDDEQFEDMEGPSSSEDAEFFLMGAQAHKKINPTNVVARLKVRSLFSQDDTEDYWRSSLIDFLEEEYGWDYRPAVPGCGNNDIGALIRAGIDAGVSGVPGSEGYGDDDIDCPTGTSCAIPTAIQTAVINALMAALKGGGVGGVSPLDGEDFNCDTLGDIAEDAAIGAGAAEGVGAQFNDFIEDACDDYGFQPDGDIGDENDDEETHFLDGMAFIDVTCFRAGAFSISATDDLDPTNQIKIHVVCLGGAESATLACTPNSVEIIPAWGNVSHSLCTLTVTIAGSLPLEIFSLTGTTTLEATLTELGIEVDWTTDRCSIETSGVDSFIVSAGPPVTLSHEFLAARTVFNALNPNVPETATAIETSAAATSPVDGTRQSDTSALFVLPLTATTGIVGSAAILGCNPLDAPGATPGIANITAILEVPNGADIVARTTVTVIGPPASAVVAIASTNLRCGEQTLVTVTVRDSASQNVSDHTRVEAITNFGGVLGGTGAVAAGLGSVVPLSSTVAETFNGVATFYLITSETHTGPYQIIATTGGGGSATGVVVTGGVSGGSLGGTFSTATVSGTNTVSCNVPAAAAPAAPAPTIAAPRTGEGAIRAPNTGDAGLAQGSSSSWTLFALAGVAAFAVAGIATLKFARR